MANLTAADIDAFKGLGICDGTLKAAQVQRVSHSEASSVCGIRYKSDHLEGVAFPYLDPSTDAVTGWRVRRDHPEVETNGTPKGKYLASPDRRHLYFSPDAYPRLADTAAPVYIVEAEKSVLALCDALNRTHRNALPIGTSGCWSWRGKVGKATSPDGTPVDMKGVLPDFDKVTWTDRDTVIIFDSNTTANGSVQAARRALAAELTGRGARVRVVDLPIEPGINGPDDYIGRHGAAAFMALVDAAKPPGSKPVTSAVVTCMSDVVSRPVEWFWPGRIAKGKLTIVVGDPGLGKSFTTTDYAARGSAGRAWPDGAPALPPMSVLMLSAEDAKDDTIKPRLVAGGADTSRVFVMDAVRAGDHERGVHLSDVEAIEAAIFSTGAKLVIIDPLSAYLGGTDSHKDSDVRSLLAPLAAMADRLGIAIVAVMHMSKGQGQRAIYRACGSIAFTAAARIVLAVAADPDNEGRRILATIKSNIAIEAAALAYRLVDGRVEWEDGPVSNVDVDALLNPAPVAHGGEQSNAEQLISELLKDDGAWPLEAREASRVAEQNGVPVRTLRWTAKRMGIRIERVGFGTSGRWVWHKPIPASPTASTPDIQTVAPIECIAPIAIGGAFLDVAGLTDEAPAHRGNTDSMTEAADADRL